MTDTTSWADVTYAVGPAAVLPPVAYLTGLVGGTAGGPVSGAWTAAVLVTLAVAVLLLPARHDLSRG